MKIVRSVLVEENDRELRSVKVAITLRVMSLAVRTPFQYSVLNTNIDNGRIIEESEDNC